jgi:hypothetical protein
MTLRYWELPNCTQLRATCSKEQTVCTLACNGKVHCMLRLHCAVE